MSLTLLQIVQDCADDIGLPTPLTVIGNTDQNIRQMLSLANLIGPFLAEKHNWERFESTFSHTTTAANDQGALATVIGADYTSIVPDTVWDSSTQRPLRPLTTEQYETALRSNITGVWLSYYIAGGRFLLMPAPPAGRVITGRYVSSGWCEDAVGTGQSRWADDTDVIRFNPTYYKLRLQEKWLQRKGLPYGEVAKDASLMELNLRSKESEDEVLSMSGDDAQKKFNPTAQIGGANWEDLATNWEELG